MGRLELAELDSIDSIRRAAAEWDDLWQHSALTLPSMRAEPLCLWLAHFARDAQVRALVVSRGGQMQAALPLIQSSRCRLFATGAQPVNEWALAGDLLLTSEEPPRDTLAALIEGLKKQPWPLLWFDRVAIAAPHWQALQQALQRAGVAHHFQPHWQSGLIEIGHDWEASVRRWPKKHVAKMQKAQSRLAESGTVGLEIKSRFADDEVEPWLRRACQLEDLSWKGTAGTSVLRTPGMFEFYLRQARQLAAWGQLEIAFLTCDGADAAFVICLPAKGRCHWLKIGYHPDQKCCSPGQLLQYLILQQFQEEPERKAIDLLGPITPALQRWEPTPYVVGRLLIAPRAGVGRLMLRACRDWWPRVKRFLPRAADTPAGSTVAM